MKNLPLVSIITVNYNQSGITCDLLKSLRKVDYPKVEIIVVDNASPADNPDVILDHYPEVKLIKSAKNLGFAGGNNLGVAAATGDLLFFLNNDTEIETGTLTVLVDFFRKVPNVGIASPKIIYYGSNGILQYAGSGGISKWTCRSKTIGHLELDIGQYDRTTPTPIVDGAAMMVPRSVVDQVGLMPELFFLYYEELDWCETIKRAGYDSYYVGEATVYHKESMSVGKFSVLKTYYMNRNRFLFIRRNFMGFQAFASSLFFVCIALPKNILKMTLAGKWKHVEALWSGFMWNVSKSRRAILDQVK